LTYFLHSNQPTSILLIDSWQIQLA